MVPAPTRLACHEGGSHAGRACRAPLKLCIEWSAVPSLGEWVVVERCTHDGRIVAAWAVLPEAAGVDGV